MIYLSSFFSTYFQPRGKSKGTAFAVNTSDVSNNNSRTPSISGVKEAYIYIHFHLNTYYCFYPYWRTENTYIVGGILEGYKNLGIWFGADFYVLGNLFKLYIIWDLSSRTTRLKCQSKANKKIFYLISDLKSNSEFRYPEPERNSSLGNFFHYSSDLEAFPTILKYNKVL